MVSLLRATIILVQQLIDEFHLNDPTVIATYVNYAVHHVLIPSCISVFMLVASYQFVHKTYYWIFPLPIDKRYEQIIELYSTTTSSGNGNGSTRMDHLKTSRILQLNSPTQKKTTISDSAERRLQKYVRDQARNRKRAIVLLQRMVLKEKYGPALLSWIVHELYVVGNVTEAIRLLDFVDSPNENNNNKKKDDIIDKETNESDRNHQNKDTSRIEKKKKRIFHAYNVTKGNNESQSQSPSPIIKIKLTTKTMKRDYGTLKMDAQQLYDETLRRKKAIDDDNDNNNSVDRQQLQQQRQRNGTIATTPIVTADQRMSMMTMNSKMMMMDYLGITV